MYEYNYCRSSHPPCIVNVCVIHVFRSREPVRNQLNIHYSMAGSLRREIVQCDCVHVQSGGDR